MENEITSYRKRIKRVGVLTVGLTVGVVQGGISLIIVPFFLLAALLGAASGRDQAMSSVVMVFAAIAMPIAYIVLGFIIGCLGAFIYNLISKMTGGIEIELGD